MTSKSARLTLLFALGLAADLFAQGEIWFSGAEGVDFHPALARGSMPAGSYAPGPVAASKQHDVLRLLFDGKRDEALALAQEHLERMTVAYLKPGGQQLFDAAFCFFARAYGLAEPILTAAAPEANDPLETRVQYAAMCEMLGELEQARDAYGSILSENLDHHGARAHLAMLLVKSEPAEAARLLKGMDPEMLIEQGPQLNQMLMSQQTLEDRLDVFEVLVGYLEAIEGRTDVSLEFLPSVIQMIGQSYHGNDVRIIELFTANNYSYGYNNPEQEERSERAAMRRRELFDRFCEALLKIPSYATYGFKYHAALIGKESNSEDSKKSGLRGLAIKILLEQPAADSVFDDPNALQTYNESWLPLLTPEEFLVWKAVENDDFTAIRTEIIRQLESAGKSEPAAFLQGIADLAAAGEEDFLGKAGEVMLAGHRGVHPENLMRLINTMIDKRKLSVDRGPLIYSRLEAMKQQQYFYASYVLNYAQERRRENIRSYEEFLDHVAGIFLGPAEGRKAFVEENYQPNYHQPGTSNGAIMAFVSFLGHMLNDYGLAAPVLAMADDLGLLRMQTYQLSNQIDNALSYYRFQNNAQGFFNDFLKESPFLKDLENFRTYPMSNLSQPTVFGFFLYQLGRTSSNQREDLLDLIQNHEPSAFGQQMILAYLSTSSSSGRMRAVASAMEPHVEAIRKLHEERQMEIAMWLQEYFQPGQSISSTIRRNAETFVTWIEEMHKKITESGSAPSSRNARRTTSFGNPPPNVEIDFFLQAQGRPDFRNAGMTLDMYAVHALVKAITEKDFDKADSVFAHYRKLAATADPEESQERMPPAFNREFYLLSQLLNNQPSLEAAGWTVKAVHEHELTGYRDDPSIQNGISRVTFAENNIDASIDAFLQASGGQTDPLMMPVWLGVAQAAAAVDPQKPAEWLRWSAETSGVEGRDAIKREIGHAVRLVLPANASTAEEGQATEQWYLQALEGEEIGLPWRQFIARHVVGPALAFESSALVGSCLDVLTAEAEEKAEGSKVSPAVPLASLIELFAGRPLPESMKPLAKRFLDLLTSQTPQIGMHELQIILNLCSRIDYPEDTFLDQLPATVRFQPGFMATMIRAGLVEEAVESVSWQLVSMPPPLQWQGRSSRRTRRIVNGRMIVETSGGGGKLQPGDVSALPVVDERLTTQMPDVLEKIADPGQRIAIELILSAGSDASNDTSVRTARLEAIRERFRLEDFRSPELARHTLGWLLCLAHDRTTDAMKAGVRQFGPELDAALLSTWGDSFKAPLDAIVRTYMLDSLTNDPLGFAAIINRRLEGIVDQPHLVQQFLEQYCYEFPNAVFDDLTALTKEKATQLIPLFNTLASLPENVYFNRRQECINGGIVCYILAGKSEAYAEWMESLGDERYQVEGYINFDNVVNLLANGLKAEGVTDERRSAILNGIFGNEILARRTSNNSLFQNLVERQVITEEDVLEHGPGWAESSPRGGAAHMELASVQQNAGRQLDALESYLSAVVESGWENNTYYSQAALAKAQLLMELGRLDSAMTWFEFIQGGRLSSSYRQRFDALYREARTQYLRQGDRAVTVLSKCRDLLEENPADVDAWKDLAEVYTSLGQQRIDSSDYQGGAALLKVAFYVFRALQEVGVPGIQAFLTDSENRLVKAQSAFGAAAMATTLVSTRSRWRYFYGQGPVDDGWKDLDFRASGWRSGRGQLGYGDSDEQTRLSYGNDEDNKPITAYFRLTFNVEDPELFDALTMGVLHDDGMIVYLNGVEVARNNMPPGPVDGDTLAPESRSSGKENEYWEAGLSAQVLQAGINVIAAEVHQNQPDSSDLGFDLFLRTEAINAKDVFAEVESGKVLRRIGEWGTYLPADLAGAMEQVRAAR